MCLCPVTFRVWWLFSSCFPCARTCGRTLFFLPQGLTVDVGLPGYCVRRGYSIHTEEAKAWARQNLPAPADAAAAAAASASSTPDKVVFLCRVVMGFGNSRQYPVL